MNTYIVLRRCGWRAPEGIRESAKRAESALEWAPDEIGWVRSYFLAEPDGTLGTVCVYRATSPEAIRAHSRRAGLPVDEIVAVAETVVVELDPVGCAA